MSCPRGCCATYREHINGLTILGPSAKRDAVKREERDMDAYKRLVQSGVQPKGIAGAAELERGAASKFEVERAAIITDAKERRKMASAFEVAQAAAPAITPLDAA